MGRFVQGDGSECNLYTTSGLRCDSNVMHDWRYFIPIWRVFRQEAMRRPTNNLDHNPEGSSQQLLFVDPWHALKVQQQERWATHASLYSGARNLRWTPKITEIQKVYSLVKVQLWAYFQYVRDRPVGTNSVCSACFHGVLPLSKQSSAAAWFHPFGTCNELFHVNVVSFLQPFVVSCFCAT